MRRKLIFTDLNEAVEECRRLLEGGYVQHGRWSLGQMCRHVRRTIESNVEGYPWWMSLLGLPLRPLLRRFALPRLLRGDSPSGVMTAPMFVPPAGLNDADEVAAFAECVRQFLAHEKKLHAHPGFGKFDRSGFNHFHAMHAAHHLGFLRPAEHHHNDDRGIN